MGIGNVGEGAWMGWLHSSLMKGLDLDVKNKFMVGKSTKKGGEKLEGMKGNKWQHKWHSSKQIHPTNWNEMED